MQSFLCDAAIAVEVLGAGYIAGSLVIHVHHRFKQTHNWRPRTPMPPVETVAKKSISTPRSVVIEPDDKPKRKPTPVELLRQQCQKAGIKWRDAHGKNKHLKKAEMIEALQQLERKQRAVAKPKPSVNSTTSRTKAA